tara:strand:+ start:492 stop:680 length:189 start_codon:yes stop_codon:yes gene_type:complete
MKSIQCNICVHHNGDWTCDAFPNGIPDEISDGKHDHSNKFKGDKGVRFQSFEDLLKNIDKGV